MIKKNFSSCLSLTGLFVFSILFLTGCDTLKPTPFDFKTLQRQDKPNSYLVCPESLCKAKLDEASPVFHVNIADLEKAWQKVIAKQSRITLLAQDRNEHRFQYVQRSFLLRFPDIINVELIPINQTESSIAIYSAAVYGYYDFNVNKKRVKKWLAELRRIIDSNVT